jgi:hypothetical protein
MMVHFGEPQVLERQVPDPIESRIHVYRPGTYLLKQVPELVSIHDASITKLLEPPGEVNLQRFNVRLLTNDSS